VIAGISGAPLPEGFPYKAIIEAVCGEAFPPCLMGAIKMNETGLGEGPAAELNISFDGGHGLMQLTSSYPTDWAEPAANFRYALEQFLLPALVDWQDAEQGDNLVRCIAATYNAGYGNAQAGHAEGDVDKYTTNRYATRALAHFTALSAGRIA
jgi:hypothetical protein